MSRTPIALVATLLLAAAAAACQSKLECPVGETGCAGACVALASNASNCGACGFACSTGACVDGACVCPPDKTECGGGCVALENDPRHCGACGNPCAPGQVCSAGSCASACLPGSTSCGGACADLSSDRWHCGTCDTSCGPGESCVERTCTTLAVACLATDEVRTLSPDLAWAGPTYPAGDAPVSLASLGGKLYAANSISHSISAIPLGGGAAAEWLFADGSDFEHVTSHGGRLFVSSSGDGTLRVVDPADGREIDAIGFGDSRANPLGLAFVEDRAYVALYGQSGLGQGEAQAGQAVAVVDFSGVAGCTQGPCGSVVATIGLDLEGIAGPDGFPFPSRAVAIGTKVYVTLANLKKGAYGYYTDPAGNGKLAVIDSANGDALSFVDLGTGCLNPGGIAARGTTTLWIACGSADSHAILPVDVSGDASVAGEPLATPLSGGGAPVVPGSIAFCGDLGYVTDLWSGDVFRFDPDGPHPVMQVVTVCPLNAPPQDFGWAWAADVACAP